MNDGQFRALLDLYMVNDPWPLTSEQDRRIKSLLTRESKRRGYDDWVDAYHDFDASEPKVPAESNPA